MTNYSIGSRPTDSVRIEDAPVHLGEASPLTNGLTSIAMSRRPLEISFAPTGAELASTVVHVSPTQLLELAGMLGPHSTDDRVNALSRYILADLRHQAGPSVSPERLSRMVHEARELAVRTLSTLHHAAEHTDALRPGVSPDTPLSVRLTGLGTHGSEVSTHLVSDWFSAPISDATVPAPTAVRTSPSHIDSPRSRHSHRAHTPTTPVRLSGDQVAELQHDLARFRRAGSGGMGVTIDRRDGGRSIPISAERTAAIANALERAGERLFLSPELLSASERADVAEVRQLIDAALHHNRAAIAAFWRGGTSVEVEHSDVLMERDRAELRAESEHERLAPARLHARAEAGESVMFQAPDGVGYTLDHMALRRLEASWSQSSSEMFPVRGFEAQLRRELATLGYQPTETDLRSAARSLMATLSEGSADT